MIRKPPALLVLLLCAAGAGAGGLPDFVPQPDSVVAGEGVFIADRTLTIVAPQALANEATFLSARLRAGLGLPAPVAAAGRGVTLALDPTLPAEGYAMDVAPAGVSILGGSPAGVFYGAQTFMQTLPAAVHGGEPDPKADWSAPALSIRDQPTMAWRGVMLDSARHFQPKAFILKFIDAMAAQKLNRLHWHLVDSEGWRLEIKKYPKLTEVTKDAPAYYPQEIPTNPTVRAKYAYGYDHGGGHYTQDDVREIVAYAAARHVVIVPEIEFPGHAKIALTAYPEISATGTVSATFHSAHPDLIGVHPEALAFLRSVLDETMDLFPGPWIHFGGDEVPKGHWRSSPSVQRKIDELGLRRNDTANPHASEDALHAWLFREMAAHVAARGRIPMGWEDVARDDNLGRLPAGSVLLPWLSRDTVVRAANAGCAIVHVDPGHFYFDTSQGDLPGEPFALYDWVIPPRRILEFELFPSGLTEAGRSRVLGAEAVVWSELTPRSDDVEYQLFPRACALAELTWTPPARRADARAFLTRVRSHGARLTAMGLNHRREPLRAPWHGHPAGPLEIPLDEELSGHAANGGALRVDFRYESGGYGLSVASVELLADGKAVAEDRHDGFAGTRPNASVYRLQASPDVGGWKRIALRVHLAEPPKADSRGVVVVMPVSGS